MPKHIPHIIKIAFKRSGAVILAVVLVGVSLLLNVYKETKTIPTAARYQQKYTVILDAGHGGFDGGAVAGDGTVEKDINLIIALKVEEILKFSGISVIMTRTKDTGTDDTDGSIAKRKKSDLENRLALMGKNPDAVYVSIHLNKFTTSAASGAQVFYTPNVESAALLAERIQSTIVETMQPENTRVIKVGGKNTYLLHLATIPAVIVECGFLSNHRELALLKDETYQSKMAFAVSCGILRYLNACETA